MQLQREWNGMKYETDVNIKKIIIKQHDSRRHNPDDKLFYINIEIGLSNNIGSISREELFEYYDIDKDVFTDSKFVSLNTIRNTISNYLIKKIFIKEYLFE